MVSQPNGLHTLGRWSAHRAGVAPEHIAIDDRGTVLSYGSLEHRAMRLAERFRAAGYGAGDRIATITGNSSDHVVLFFACAKAGLVLVPLSWRLTPAELAVQLDLAEPALLLLEDEFSTLGEVTLGVCAWDPPVTRLGIQGVEHRIPPARRRAGEPAPAPRSVADDDALLLIFTSGTTGGVKGALLTHANCFWTNLALARTIDVGSEDVVLAVMPQFHVGGWNVQPLLAWWVGATVVLERSFDPGRVLQLIAHRRVTTMMGVPANYLLLSQHPAFADTDVSSLRHAVVGGAPMPLPLLRVWHGRGVQLSQGYGLTEASPNVLCLPNHEAIERAGSAGRPYAYVEVALADPVSGQLVSGPGRGELLVQGPGVFAGYFRDPAATTLALHDGWLHTGDLVERGDDGRYTVVDRLKDIYISGGEGVAPAEVEAVLFGHPAVADVGVVGVPDERWGEVGAAFVVLRPDRATDAEDLLAHARQSLASFKLPKHVRYVERIPRSHADKVLRRELLTMWGQRSEV